MAVVWAAYFSANPQNRGSNFIKQNLHFYSIEVLFLANRTSIFPGDFHRNPPALKYKFTLHLLFLAFPHTIQVFLPVTLPCFRHKPNAILITFQHYFQLVPSKYASTVHIRQNRPYELDKRFSISYLRAGFKDHLSTTNNINLITIQ